MLQPAVVHRLRLSQRAVDSYVMWVRLAGPRWPLLEALNDA
jgi:hypothetical protein